MQTPTDLMNFRLKIDMMLDNALSEDDQQEVLSFIDSDPTCNKMYQNEQSFRHFVKNNVRRPEVTPDFINSIKASVNIY